MLSRIFTGKNSRKDKQVTLVVKDGEDEVETCIRVGRAALVEHSAVFRGDRIRKGSKIVLQDVTSLALHKIAEYIQKSSVSFLNHSEALETLAAADKYRFDDLSKICVDNLVTVLDSSNVCDVYDAMSSSRLLEYHCLRLVDREAEAVLGSRGFSTLRKATALSIVKRDSLNVASEMSVFRAVLGWGLNACLRQGGDPNDSERFLPLVKHLLNYVRFGAMSEDEMRDPDVLQYHTLMTASVDHGPFQARNTPNPVFSKDRSMSTASRSSMTSLSDPHPRQFVSSYSHSLDLLECEHQQVKTGESFSLALEVLKGRIFLTCVRLAFAPFAATKRAACLYVAVTASNAATSDQRSTRGTFSSGVDDDEASLRFAEPLVAHENQRVSVTVCVKRAENARLFALKSDVQIAMPESKAVAMKVAPLRASGADGTERCILKEFEYFF